MSSNLPSRRSRLDRLAARVGELYGAFFEAPPEQVRVWRADDALTMLVDEPPTDLEARLLDLGERDLVRRERAALREHLAPVLTATAEQVLGGRVESVGGTSDPDTGRELLLFRFSGGDGQRGGASARASSTASS